MQAVPGQYRPEMMVVVLEGGPKSVVKKFRPVILTYILWKKMRSIVADECLAEDSLL